MFIGGCLWRTQESVWVRFSGLEFFLVRDLFILYNNLLLHRLWLLGNLRSRYNVLSILAILVFLFLLIFLIFLSFGRFLLAATA